MQLNRTFAQFIFFISAIFTCEKFAIAQPGILDRLEQRVRDGLLSPPASESAAVPSPVQPPRETSKPANSLPVPRSLDNSPDSVVLGLELEEIFIPGGGLLVAAVAAGSPADAAGVRPRDVLQMIDGRVVLKLSDMVEVLSKHRPADRIMLRLQRDGLVLETAALLGATGSGAKKDLPTNATAPSSTATGPGARLGADVDDFTGTATDKTVQRGAVIVSVKPNSPAAAIGMQIGDVIAAVDGRLVTGVRSMVVAMQLLKPGQSAEITYFSGKEMLRRQVIVAGPEGVLSSDVYAKLREQQGTGSGTTPESSGGIGGWFGGLGKMFSSKPESTTETSSQLPPVAPVVILPPAETGNERAMQARVKQLEQRIVELEQQLNSKQRP